MKRVIAGLAFTPMRSGFESFWLRKASTRF
jgi:hypothetical protein